MSNRIQYYSKNTTLNVIEGPEERYERRAAIARQWEPAHEMYPLKYGPILLSAVAAATAVPVVHHYRKLLSLGKKGWGTSLIITVAIPSLVLGMFQYARVVQPMMTQRLLCPVCFETRSALMQLIGGVVSPIVIGSTISIFLASSHSTAPLPELNDKKYMFRHFVQMSKPIASRVMLFSALQLALGVLMVKFQFESIIRLVAYEQSSPVPKRKPAVVVIAADPQQTLDDK